MTALRPTTDDKRAHDKRVQSHRASHTPPHHPSRSLPRLTMVGAVAAAVAAPLIAAPAQAHSGASASTASTASTASSFVAAGAPVAALPAAPSRDELPLGDKGLPEKRTVTAVAPGVVRHYIERGETTATPARIDRTTTGPWRVNAITIDPKRSNLKLRTTYGPTLMAPETTSALSAYAGARVAMNASFFNINAPAGLRGDPVGLAVSAGTVTSEQTGTGAEHNVLIDADRGRLRMGQFTWRGYVEDRKTGKRRTLAGVNRTPRVPAACTGENPDAAACAGTKGELVRFSPRYAAATPGGPGAEAVFGPDGCLVRVSSTRGTRLSSAQFSIQGTGDRAAQILREAPGSCVRFDEGVYTSSGEKLGLNKDTYGVTGRYRLVRDGKVISNTGTAQLSGRHPRSIIGRKADGRIMLVTIDGRRTTSVGASLVEAARVARSLGMVDAVNLDGGGSTTMVINNRVINTVSGSAQRAVGDALVLSR
ncbi:exopolysaccharide biosynthesis protein [Kineosphaera limosa]|uniref:Phosphodiester glycosidase domain-containing protein n=1 Tax=Kineosphaera limosa NBRC 100340 TaxID=1184609 RepID=K6VPA6_9MICO|nr:phosphodiester glycosidase family protein [Kineosphaera limosa]NYE02016.1 exopolysaccharide biosynthesis protein [Kineosphaera limosa]GAB98053.1 hypothetical protein KILIM_097_00020 [Kineosphaera limosa NBRC 100340]